LLIFPALGAGLGPGAGLALGAGLLTPPLAGINPIDSSFDG
jgi:hypothetical protein